MPILISVHWLYCQRPDTLPANAVARALTLFSLWSRWIYAHHTYDLFSQTINTRSRLWHPTGNWCHGGVLSSSVYVVVCVCVYTCVRRCLSTCILVFVFIWITVVYYLWSQNHLYGSGAKVKGNISWLIPCAKPLVSPLRDLRRKEDIPQWRFHRRQRR